MKIKGEDLIQGVKKSKGVVNETSVIEYLRGFRLNPRPDKGLLDLAGSDGRMTLLATIPYERTSNSDDTMLSIPSDKIQELVKYIKSDDEVEFLYNEKSSNVDVLIGRYRLKILKKDFENALINFDVIDETQFDDVVDRNEFIFVLECLIHILAPELNDLVYQTIYFDGETAYAFTGDIYSRIKFKTNGQYLIDYRIAKQLLLLLKNTTGDKVYLKYYKDDAQVMIKTDSDILLYRLMDDEIYKVDAMNKFKKDFSLSVDMSNLVRALYMTSLGSEDGDVEIVIQDNKLKLKTLNDLGELAYDEVDISNVTGDVTNDTLTILYSSLIKLSKAIREKEVNLDFDLDNLILKIKGTDGYTEGYMTFEC